MKLTSLPCGIELLGYCWFHSRSDPSSVDTVYMTQRTDWFGRHLIMLH